MDKELATKLLGFRDADGKLVCPADVLDTSKTYTVYLIPQKGATPPSSAEVEAVGKAFKALGFTGALKAEDYKGKKATDFLNKKGDVVCRIAEGKAEPPPSPPKKEEKEEVETTATEVATATTTTRVSVTTKKGKKKSVKKPSK